MNGLFAVLYTNFTKAKRVVGCLRICKLLNNPQTDTITNLVDCVTRLLFSKWPLRGCRTGIYRGSNVNSL